MLTTWTPAHMPEKEDGNDRALFDGLKISDNKELCENTWDPSWTFGL